MEYSIKKKKLSLREGKKRYLLVLFCVVYLSIYISLTLTWISTLKDNVFNGRRHFYTLCLTCGWYIKLCLSQTEVMFSNKMKAPTLCSRSLYLVWRGLWFCFLSPYLVCQTEFYNSFVVTNIQGCLNMFGVSFRGR